MTTSDPPSDEAARTLRQGPSQGPAEDVARLRELLWEVAAFERSRAARRIPRIGLVVAVIGVLVGVLAVVAEGLVRRALFVHFGLALLTDPDVEWTRTKLLVALATSGLPILVLAHCGFVLAVVGLAFRKRRNWARLSIVVVLWVTIVFVAAYGVVGTAAAAILTALDVKFVPYLCAVPLVAAFWGFPLWPALRYFSSPAVIAACRGRAIRSADPERCLG